MCTITDIWILYSKKYKLYTYNIIWILTSREAVNLPRSIVLSYTIIFVSDAFEQL